MPPRVVNLLHAVLQQPYARIRLPVTEIRGLFRHDGIEPPLHIDKRAHLITQISTKHDGSTALSNGKTVPSVMLVSNYRLLRETIRLLIEGGRGFQVLAETDERGQTLRAATDLRPDLIVFDLDPDWTGAIVTIRQLIRNCPGSQVVALSLHTEDAIVEGTLRAGVRAFLSKEGPSEEIVAVLRLVANGEAYLSPRIAARVMDWVKNREIAGASIPALVGLTERELETLRLLAEGRSSKEVAVALDLSVETVRTYRKFLMRKLKVHNLAGLVRIAATTGLLSVIAEQRVREADYLGW